MKFSQATLFAILATSTFVSAAPAIVVEQQSLVKREDINDVLEILKELKSINAKRDFVEGEELQQLTTRADSVLGELITALTNSGIIGQIWNTLTTDPAITSTLSAIIKSAIQTAVVQGPALIQAVWNSGLLGNIFNKFLNDADLKTALFDVAKSIFGSAVNLITAWLSGSSSSTAAATTTAAAAAPSAAKRADIIDPNSEYLSERDLASIIQWIVQEISDSGIVQSLVNKVLADPNAAISFLTSAFQTGLVVAEDIYSWAKSSGLWDSALSYIEANAGTWAGAIASFLGNALTTGKISASDIDNAGTLSTSTASTAAPVAARSVSVSQAVVAATTKATTTAAAAAVTTAKATTTAAAAAGTTAAAANNNNALNSLINKYGGSVTTTAPQVNTAGLASSLNTLVGAANQAAGSLGKRRLY